MWKFNAEASSFDSISPLKGHIGAVVSLIYGANRLYSGSMDNTIRVWDLETMQCIHTLAKHSEVVMSVLCWERYLISSSLDRTLKVFCFVPMSSSLYGSIHSSQLVLPSILPLYMLCDL